MKKKFAVVLSGCGFQDGSEIHESVLSLYAIVRRGAEYTCFAPDIEQRRVVNHYTGETSGEKRGVLAESARIARGEIFSLAELDCKRFDILLFPGGFGAALNLCTFGVHGPSCRVNAEVETAVREFHKAGKPIGALCIAPVILAKVLGAGKVTAGQSEDVNRALAAMGAEFRNTGPGEVVVDEDNKLVTSPCYMLESAIDQIARGADNAVKALLELA
jgi:enhancing lycopene biosynthesis protein 2